MHAAHAISIGLVVRDKRELLAGQFPINDFMFAAEQIPFNLPGAGIAFVAKLRGEEPDLSHRIARRLPGR
ncbi:MAG: hypothetical protein U5O39_10300 [Gammaproteobacteria bacterium]|nr:hypothetical protein [Gammaproteobacteria bacterium]